MQTLTKRIVEAGWSERVVTETQLARLLNGSPQRRYSLVNRALHYGELLRLRRGRYLLASSLRCSSPHPFVLAQALQPGSYISFESALSFHGWIPEATAVTLSVVPGRRRYETYHPQFGLFRYCPLALQRGYFLEGVDRLVLEEQTSLVAQPLRALLDLFYLRKEDFPGREALEQGMRIEQEILDGVRDEDLQRLMQVYLHQRMHKLIDAMRRGRAG